ncbi:MAG: hypothetical protein GY711_13380 [bacterium]|nr:hypothetical protein [bacterium]
MPVEPSLSQEGLGADWDAFVAAVYQDLRMRAQSCMRDERVGHTLQPTALIHETYLKLMGRGAISWKNRLEFYGAAMTAMRRILVDHARHRGRERRSGHLVRVPFELAEGGRAAALVQVEVGAELPEVARFGERVLHTHLAPDLEPFVVGDVLQLVLTGEGDQREVVRRVRSPEVDHVGHGVPHAGGAVPHPRVDDHDLAALLDNHGRLAALRELAPVDVGQRRCHLTDLGGDVRVGGRHLLGGRVVRPENEGENERGDACVIHVDRRLGTGSRGAAAIVRAHPRSKGRGAVRGARGPPNPRKLSGTVHRNGTRHPKVSVGCSVGEDSSAFNES